MLLIAFFAILAFSAEKLAVYISFEKEKELAVSLGIGREETAEKHREKEKYLQELAARLAVYQDLPEGMTITLHYNPGGVVNAFATLGGNIYIYQGLIDRLESEDALAMVIAHEIGHIKLRHPAQAASRGLMVVLGATFLSAVTGIDFVQWAVDIVGTLTVYAFTREQEREADRIAVTAIREEYGHVAGVEELFRALKKAEEEIMPIKIPEFMKTHPDTEGRLEEVTRARDQEGWPMDQPVKALPPMLAAKEPGKGEKGALQKVKTKEAVAQ